MKRRFEGPTFPLHEQFADILPAMLLRTPEHKTMLLEYRLRILYELAITVSWLDGDIAEAGVWRGGVTYLLASVLKDKAVHAFDSWEGLPGLTEEDCVEGTDRVLWAYKGWGKCDQPVEFLSKFDNVVFHKGWFVDTFPEVADKKFCLVHVDCDLYQPVKECMEFFVPRMVPGGFMVIDDYGDPNVFPGAVKAVDEYFENYTGKITYWKWVGPIIRFDND